ncbi:MAG: 30S ribosomal protein S6 [Alphaproteobacteria bacterium]|jgi:small subunit ribosomal protein S6|nr:30S ribosomal protein S6 [Alphaproteobacteria bacterium]MBP9777232.1 30S ribosomal protein S6 [Alphaproteobacteria bacterium]
MAFYETVFIARQELSAAQVEALAANLTEVITQGQGEMTKTEFCGLRTLAYSIKKNRKGHYVLFNIDAPFAAVKEMERQMSLNEDILRVLTLKIDKLDTEPSPLMQSKQSRDRRFESFEENTNFRSFDEEGEKE